MTKPPSEPRSTIAGDIPEPDGPPTLVKIRLHGPAVMIILSGEEDVSSAERVTVHRFVPRGRQALVLDVTDVGFLAGQGLRALLGLGEQCGRAGATWARVTGQSMTGQLRAFGRRDLVSTVTTAEALQEAT